MAEPAISGNDVFSHVCVGTDDLLGTSAFYDAALATLGIRNMGPFGDTITIYGKDKPAFLVLQPSNGEPASVSNGATLGFSAKTTAEVDAFHAAGLANGGTDEGSPGPRGHLPGSYAAYVRDPAGNKICAFTFTE